MKAGIHGLDVVGVALVEVELLELHGLAQLTQAVLGQVVDEAPHRQTLDAQSDGAHVLEVLAHHAQHHRAPGAVLDQVLLRQPPQRLPHRRAAHAQLGAQLQLRDHLAALVLATENLRLQALKHLVGQGNGLVFYAHVSFLPHSLR